jgi:putative MATE family efflux protein
LRKRRPDTGLDGEASTLDARFRHILHGSLLSGMLRLGGPLVIGMVLQGTFNLVDSFVVGRLGTESLSALPVGDLLAMLGTVAANGVATASVALIARFQGEGDTEGIRRVAAQSTFMILLLSAFFFVLGVFGAEALTKGLGAKGRVQELAEAYVQVMVGGAATMLVLWHLVGVLRAVGDATVPMYLLIGANILNLPLSIIMCFGPGPAPEIFAWAPPIAEAFGIPRMDVAGAAWSTIISRAIVVVFAAVFAWKRHEYFRFGLRDLKPVLDEQLRIIRLAVPNTTQATLRLGVYLFFAAIILHRFTTPDDPAAFAAYGVCIRLETVALFAGMGWGGAASTFVGQNLGAMQPGRAVAAGWVASGYNTIMMILLFGTYLAFAEPILAFFDPNPKVVEVGAEYLLYAGTSYICLGTAIVLANALSGAGATLSSMVVDLMVLLGFLFPVTIAVVILAEPDRKTVWLLIAAGNVLSLVAHSTWFAMTRWIDKSL